MALTFSLHSDMDLPKASYYTFTPTPTHSSTLLTFLITIILQKILPMIPSITAHAQLLRYSLFWPNSSRSPQGFWTHIFCPQRALTHTETKHWLLNYLSKANDRTCLLLSSTTSGLWVVILNSLFGTQRPRWCFPNHHTKGGADSDATCHSPSLTAKELSALFLPLVGHFKPFGPHNFVLLDLNPKCSQQALPYMAPKISLLISHMGSCHSSVLKPRMV